MEVFAILLVFGTIAFVIRRHNSGKRLRATTSTQSLATATRANVIGGDLQRFAKMLAGTAWGPRELNMSTDLVLDVKSLGSVRGNPALVETMLRHVRTVAPGINVPFKTPHVVVGPLLQAAGLFSERDGWVTLTVSEGFFDHRDAACAILCHEIAHYVLNACGIRESERGANERLTDVAMFVFGLGDVFLAGYKAAPMAYRPGHKLGYLSEAEYDFVDKHVFELHLHGTAQSAQSDIQERRFKAVVPDAAARGRLIEAEKKKRPSASYAELVSGILDTYRPR